MLQMFKWFEMWDGRAIGLSESENVFLEIFEPRFQLRLA